MKNFFTFSRVALGVLIAVAVLTVIFVAPQAEAAGNICCTDRGEGQLSVLDNGRIYLRWAMVAPNQGVTLTVSGPCGTIRRHYDKGEDPLFALEELEPDDTTGVYNWELRIDPQIDPAVADQLAEARGTGEEEEVFKALRRKGLLPQGPFIQSGEFEVVEGEIVDFTAGGEKERLRAEMPDGGTAGNPGAGLGVIGASASAGGISNVTGEQVISGDLVVYNSICVGFDCPTNPSFGADTIRLQENNLRIHIDDTSTAASFPRTDWRLEFNSQANGGGSYFRVVDASASRSIMTLEANAPSHSLYVDDGGRLGLGTSSPVLELHVVDGDTPALRLEQDTSSGFAAQTWDIAGNETSFFIRDATNGSTLPFRIFPDMPSGTLVLRNDNVGIGTTSPNALLHVVRTASGNAELTKLTNNGPIDFVMERTDIADRDWRFESENSGFFISRIGSGDTEFDLSNNGDLTLAGSLVTGGGGTCDPGPCDRTFAPDYEVTPIEEHAAYMWQNHHLWGVGPTPEGQPINVSKKLTGMLHELEVAHIYIEQLNDGLKTKDARIQHLENQVQELSSVKERLAALEAMLLESAAPDAR